MSRPNIYDVIGEPDEGPISNFYAKHGSPVVRGPGPSVSSSPAPSITDLEIASNLLRDARTQPKNPQAESWALEALTHFQKADIQYRQQSGVDKLRIECLCNMAECCMAISKVRCAKGDYGHIYNEFYYPCVKHMTRARELCDHRYALSLDQGRPQDQQEREFGTCVEMLVQDSEDMGHELERARKHFENKIDDSIRERDARRAEFAASGLSHDRGTMPFKKSKFTLQREEWQRALSAIERLLVDIEKGKKELRSLA